MNIKSGVRVRGIRPEMIVALIVAQGVFVDHDTPITITSASDGKHSRTSLHYAGCALDLRRHDADRMGTTDAIDRDLKARLGALGDFDVVLETTHWHIEYQPKGMMNA